MSRAGRGRHRGGYRNRSRYRRRTRAQYGAHAQFKRVLDYAPNSRRGKVVFKWDHATGDFNTSAFNSVNVLSNRF
jgi:hypothetical protein